MKPKLYCAAISLLVLGACGSSEPSQPTSSQIDASVQDGAEQLIRGKLRDPESASFTEVHVAFHGQPIACGKVNSKNGFGGMTGPQRFISNGRDLAFLEEQTEPGTMDQLWPRYCA